MSKKNGYKMFKSQEEKDRVKLDEARDAKCIPLAKAYLQTILDANVSLSGKLTPEQLRKEYEPIMLKMIDLYLEAGLTMIEIGYVAKLVREMLDNSENLLVESVNNSLRLAEKKLFNCDKESLTLNRLDEILKQ